MVTVTIAGQNARQLQQMLVASGMQVAAVDLDRLQVLAQATTAEPDVLVIDLRADSGIPPAVSAIRQQHPRIGIVIVTASMDPNFLLAALRAGANEVVAEPLTAATLEHAIAGVARRRTFAEAGRVFGFVGAKGGIGKTTLAINVATAISMLTRPARTLLMDVHQFGGDAALYFGAEPTHSISDALENTHRLDEAFFRGLVTEVQPMLDLIGSADQVPTAPVDPARFRALIDFTSSVYNFTVLDLPGSDFAVLDSLDRLNAIVIVVNQELGTVRAARRLASLLLRRYGSEKVMLVVTRIDKVSEITLAEIERSVGLPVTHTFPNDYRLALRALHAGRPMMLEDHHQLPDAIERFAIRLSGAEPERATHRGFFSRMAGAGAH